MDRPAVIVSPVASLRDRRAFEGFPWRVYRGDPLWVPPFVRDRRKAMDPDRGEFFLHGEAQFFLARREGSDEVIGTICAAQDFAANRNNQVKDCMFGFLDFLDQPDILPALIAACEAWARSRGLDSLLGPYNLNYEDGYGVLIEGRDRPPALLCGHTPPWYQAAFEALGFTPAHGDNIAYEIRLDRPLPDYERLRNFAEKAQARSGLSVRSADFAHYEDEVDRVRDLLDRSLAHIPGFIPWERSAVKALFDPFLRFADPDLVLFAEKAGEVVGFLPGMPDLYEAIKGLNGLRRPWDYLRLPFAFKRRFKCITIKSVLVPPEHWGTGVAGLLIYEMARRLEGRGYRWMDLSLTSDDNPNTPPLVERFGGRIYKRFRVYRRPIPPGRGDGGGREG
jgi:GNAT superfamily N-acetyltransferase